MPIRPTQITTGYGNGWDGDIMTDGTVNFADLARAKAVFFGRPGPSGLAR